MKVKKILLLLYAMGAAVFIGWFCISSFNVLINTKTAVSNKEQKIVVSTDKTEYEMGEIIKISLTNVTNNLIKQEIIPQAQAKLTKFLGKNCGVGIIEKHEQENWVEVEPVWRCKNSCFAECLIDQSIKQGKTKAFEWDQTVHICNQKNHSEIIEYAQPGKYRVYTPVWFDEEQTNRLVYSNEFIIK